MRYISLATDRARLAEHARMWRALADACTDGETSRAAENEPRSWRD
jgi:hypothetical protein